MRVLLIYTDAPWYAASGYDDAWRRALEERGCEVEVLARMPADWGTRGPPTDRWDLVIPHVLVEEVIAHAETLRLAALLEATGHPLLNPVGSVLASSDKLVTHAVWAAAEVAQPRAWDLATVDAWPAPAGSPMVLKPAYCDGARHIQLVGTLEEAHAVEREWREDERRGGERRGTAMLQDWVEEPATVRLFASPERVSLAYEKAREPGVLVTHGTVYPRIYEPPPAMAELARRMVSSLGGGLMGVDVLTDSAGDHFALEANAPFGFDVTDPDQGRFVAAVALEVAERRSAQLRGSRASAIAVESSIFSTT